MLLATVTPVDDVYVLNIDELMKRWLFSLSRVAIPL